MCSCAPRAPPPPMQPDRFSSVLSAIYRRRLTILLITGATIATSLFFAAKQPKVYMVKASVFVPKEMPRLSLTSEGANIPQGPVLPDTTEGTRVGMTGLINSGAVHDRVAELFAAKGITLDPRKIRKTVFGDIDNYQALVVYAYDRKPEMAVDLANTFVQAFRELMSKQVAQGPEESLKAFQGEMSRTEGALQAATARRTEFLGQLGTADLDADLNLNTQARERILQNLQDLDVQEHQLLAEKPALEQSIAARPEFSLASKQDQPNSAYYQALRAATEARTDLAVKLLTYTSEHPIIKALGERIQSLDANAAEEAKKTFLPGTQTTNLDQIALGLINQKVQQDVSMASIAPMRATLQGKLTEAEAKLAAYPANKVALDKIDFEISRDRSQFQEVTARAQELTVQLQRGFDVTFTDEHRLAELDDAKVIPTQAGILFFSVLGGLTVGIFVALLMEMVARMRQNYPF